MPRSSPAPRPFHGQILLERAVFCVGCEIIFTGSRRCPRCSSVETIWPLAEWVRSVRPATATVSLPQTAGEASLPSGRAPKRSAA